MRSIRIILMVVVLPVALSALVGCGSKTAQIQPTPVADGYLGFPHWVDVYINDALEVFSVGNSKVEGNVLLFEGDYVIFNNIANEKLTLKLPEDWFEVQEVTIEPNKRKALKVKIKGPATGDITSVIQDITKHGTPKMKVGEEP